MSVPLRQTEGMNTNEAHMVGSSVSPLLRRLPEELWAEVLMHFADDVRDLAKVETALGAAALEALQARQERRTITAPLLPPQMYVDSVGAHVCAHQWTEARGLRARVAVRRREAQLSPRMGGDVQVLWVHARTGRPCRGEQDLPSVITGVRVFKWYSLQHLQHRGGDQPAVVRAANSCEWWLHGQRHRDGGRPAVVHIDGRCEYWEHGQRHRADGLPAVVWCADGSREYWVRGERHRDGDRPAVVRADGCREWWERGQRHRGGDRPAVVHLHHVTSGYCCEWWFDGVPARASGGPTNVLRGENRQVWLDAQGRMHRTDGGPAVVEVRADGRERREWYVGGKRHRAAGAGEAQLPAVEDDWTGTREWYVLDRLHREGREHKGGLPAVEVNQPGMRRREWYWNGVLHREHDLPAVVEDWTTSQNDGRGKTKKTAHRSEWWRYGVRHRGGGRPAINDNSLHEGMRLSWFVNDRWQPNRDAARTAALSWM